MKKFYFFLFFFFSVGLSFAQERRAVAASIDKTVIFIGEQATLTLQANFPAGAPPAFFILDSIPHFEILNQSKIDTQATAGGTQLEQTLTLTSFDSGAWQIPSLELAGAHTQSLKVVVTFSPFDRNQDYHDVKDILNVPQPGRTTWYWYLIGAMLLLLLFLLLFPKKKKQAGDEPVTNPGAYKLALQQLETLRKKRPADEKVYYSELIDIFRSYLHQRKGIHSFQKTTDDLSRQLADLKLNERDFKTLVATLQLSDFVKFARYTPTEGEKEESLETIKNSITAIEQLK